MRVAINNVHMRLQGFLSEMTIADVAQMASAARAKVLAPHGSLSALLTEELSHEAPIYLDNNATTPVDPRVLEAMLPYFREKFGNAASRTHAFGWEAEAAVDRPASRWPRLINADAKEIIWTSGATESDNIAVKGAADRTASKGRHIITQVTEHKAILDPCKYLEAQGSR